MRNVRRHSALGGLGVRAQLFLKDALGYILVKTPLQARAVIAGFGLGFVLVPKASASSSAQ